MTQPLRRSTFTVDLGPELSAQLRAAAAAVGRTPSQLTRELIQREMLGTGASQVSAPGAAPAAEPSRPGRVGHMQLDAELAGMAKRVQEQGQFRSRPAALKVALRQFLTGQDTSSLKDGVTALARSNHELLPIGRNLNQIAKQLNAMVAGVRPNELRNIDAFVAELREHLEMTSQLASASRAVVTSHKGDL
jgi:hypothetical protein